MSAAEANGAAPISPAELQEIVRVFADSDLRELRLTVGSVDLLVSRNEQVDLATPTPAASNLASARSAQPAPATPQQGHAPEPAAATEAALGSAAPSDRVGLVAVDAPALGTFYRRPAPDQPPFVEVGTEIAVGDAVGTIEVMKMFTTVTAHVAGTIREICVEDAALVEHGQPLFYVEPAAT